MKKLLALLMAASMLLMSSCGPSGTQNNSKNGVNTEEMYFVYDAEDTSHNYLLESLSSIATFNYTIIEPLVGFDRFGRTKPAAAVSYEISEDGLKWTFKLREGAKWYTYDKKEYADVTAHDFVAGIKYVLQKDYASRVSNLVYNHILNAKEYYEGEITDFSEVGVKAIDDYTLEYTLIKPAPYFLRFLSNGCWYPVCQKFIDSLEDPKIFGTSCDTMLYNGPYINTIWEHETRKVRELNEKYWDYDSFTVKTITDTYNKEAKTIAPDLFLRGEITEVDIGAAIADEWLNDPEKRKLLSYSPVTGYSNQLFVNFNPTYDESYRPEDWKKCANNLNFRKAIWHGTDVERIVAALYPITWQNVINATPTAPDMIIANGTDYTSQPALEKYKPGASYDLELAKQYKEKAMEELKDKVQFPIPVVYPHNTSQEQIDRAVVFEQMLEENLGKDFVDVILVSYPSTGFTGKVITPGLWSLAPIGWGPYYGDPAATLEIYMDENGGGAIYGKAFLAEDFGPVAAKLQEADNERIDNDKRMKLFSEAESMILENAYSLPLHRKGGGLFATYRDPFSQDCSMYGRANRINHVKLLEKPLGFDEYKEAYEKWQKEREEALKDPEANWK